MGQEGGDDRSGVPAGAIPLRPNLTAERAVPDARPQKRGWLPDPEQVWLASRVLAVSILFVWLVAWPVGTTLANYVETGVVHFGFGYSGAVFVLALTNAGLVIAGGYLLRASLRLEATADRLGDAVRLFEPFSRTENLRSDLNLLGSEVDRALTKLASAERQIRQQVSAIDDATETLRKGSVSTSDRLAKERQALIDATKAMNAEAEAFASALAEQSSRDREEAAAAAPAIDAQVKRLEKISQESAEQFASLREAMAESNALLRDAPGNIGDLRTSTESLQSAQKALIEESERLRVLIEQQKDRADNLGRNLAQQTEKLAKRKEETKSVGGSWRKILDKVEKQVFQEMTEAPAQSRAPRPAPQPPAAPPAGTADERQRLDRLQRFTITMKSRLFDMPTRSELDRFEAGERQLFTQQLLSHEQMELRVRLRHTINEDESFAAAADAFLGDFDQLLAPIMAEDPEGAEAALQEMLRSPLGQLYVLIGTAKGHFV